MKPKEWILKVPVYEPGKPIEEVARELGFADAAEIIKVASNENELGPSPKAVEAMHVATSEIHRYPDGGCFYLKDKLSAQLGVRSENLLFGNGSNELIEFLGHVFLGAEANIVVSECAFVVYRLVAALFNAQALAVPMKGFTHDLGAMTAAITPETRMIAVCNPNNPTGTINTAVEIEAFINAVPNDVLIVFDEAYLELMPDHAKPDLLKHIRAGRENLIVLRTFSKAYGLAGLRIGYAVAHEELIKRLNHVRQPFNVNAMAQAAALAALDDTGHITQTRDTVREGLEFFYAEFEKLGLEYVPSFANFVLVKTGAGSEQFSELQKRKVIVRPMGGYVLPEWIRITVGTSEQNETIMAALKDVL